MKTTFLRKMAMCVAMTVIPTLSVNAQEEEVAASNKPTVFVEASGTSSEAKAVRNAVLTALSNCGRLIILDAESEAIASKEDIRRTGENVTSGSDMVAERMGAVVRLGAQYYLNVTVDDVSHTSTKGSSSTTANCKITVTVKAIDPSESKVLSTQQMNFTGSNSKNLRDEAFNSALESITSKGSVLGQNPLLQFIDSQFPVVCQILEINEAKKDKAVTVYVNAGSDNGVTKGTKFEVFKDKKVGSRVASVPVGELTAEDVQAGDLTLCKVSKGAEVIFTEFNNGTTLKVKSRAKKDVWGKIGL